MCNEFRWFFLFVFPSSRKKKLPFTRSHVNIVGALSLNARVCVCTYLIHHLPPRRKRAAASPAERKIHQLYYKLTPGTDCCWCCAASDVCARRVLCSCYCGVLNLLFRNILHIWIIYYKIFNSNSVLLRERDKLLYISNVKEWEDILVVYCRQERNLLSTSDARLQEWARTAFLETRSLIILLCIWIFFFTKSFYFIVHFLTRVNSADWDMDAGIYYDWSFSCLRIASWRVVFLIRSYTV